MSRERYTFRPSRKLDSHRKAWAYLQAVPEGQRNDFLVRAILRMQDDTVLEETLRGILREELRAAPLRPENVHEKEPETEPMDPIVPQEMLSFLGDLMQEG